MIDAYCPDDKIINAALLLNNYLIEIGVEFITMPSQYNRFKKRREVATSTPELPYDIDEKIALKAELLNNYILQKKANYIKMASKHETEIKKIEKVFNFSFSYLKSISKDKRANICDNKRMVCGYMRNVLNLTYSQMAELLPFSKKSIFKFVNTHNDYMLYDPKYKDKYNGYLNNKNN